MQFKYKDIKIDKILLDPNNYRFLDLPQWRRRVVTRFHQPSVQEATLTLLERTPRYSLRDLRDSIMANGFVPLERIVVVPYVSSKGYF